MEPLIKVEDIHKIYNPGENEVRALDGVSLEIQRGEFVAIVGHSGSGKSTLMNMLGCLDTPTSGHYFLEGKDVSSLSDDQLSEIRNKKIGFIFQGFNLIPNLDAVGNVELPLIYRGLGKQRRRRIAVQALTKVGLGRRLKHRPSELSGGQQQRVAVARAIAAQLSVPLIADASIYVDGAMSGGGGAYFYDADPTDNVIQYVETMAVSTWDGSSIVGRTARFSTNSTM